MKKIDASKAATLHTLREGKECPCIFTLSGGSYALSMFRCFIPN
jgi:hypothetical protein